MGDSNPTEELRARLDGLGVRNWEGDDERKTLWESNGLTWEYFNDDNGDAWLGFLGACEHDVTPEQAIAATVGAGTCTIVKTWTDSEQMTDEQRKRVHDITYSTDDREELAERIVRLEDERDLYSSLVEDMDHPDTANQLRAENAKLQDENARLRSCMSDDAENARQIMGENARLRELLDGCAVLLTDCDFLHWPELCDEVLGGMRELGVEVDG